MFTARYGLGLYIKFRLNCTTKLFSLCFPAVKGKACEIPVTLSSSTSCTSNVCAGMPTHTHTHTHTHKPTYADLQLSSQEQNPLAFNMFQCSVELSQCVSCCRQKNSRGVCVRARVCVRAPAFRIALLRRLVTEALA